MKAGLATSLIWPWQRNKPASRDHRRAARIGIMLLPRGISFKRFSAWLYSQITSTRLLNLALTIVRGGLPKQAIQ